MKYAILPTQTKYNGVLYRSKLEAIFAHFLDSTNLFIDCEYEPMSLGGYVPDFIGFSTTTLHYVFIEIKPCFEFIELDKYIKYIGNDTLVILFENNMNPSAIVINSGDCPLQDWLNKWFLTEKAKSIYKYSKSCIQSGVHCDNRKIPYFDNNTYVKLRNG